MKNSQGTVAMCMIDDYYYLLRFANFSYKKASGHDTDNVSVILNQGQTQIAKDNGKTFLTIKATY